MCAGNCAMWSIIIIVVIINFTIMNVFQLQLAQIDKPVVKGISANGQVIMTSLHSHPSMTDHRKNSPLRLGRKIYEFYTAPITKFWANAVSIVEHRLAS